MTRLVGLLLLIGILFSCSEQVDYETGNLPEIHLTYDAELNAGDYAPATFVWEDSTGKMQIKKNIKLRYRGNSSLKYPKKNFSVKFKNGTSLFGLPKNKRWKLNAEYIDKTFLRNKVSYDLFRAFSPGNFAPEIRYCVVYLNDEYNGIYTLTQSVDADNLGLDKKDPKAVLFKEPSICESTESHAENQRKLRKYIRTSIRYEDYSENARGKLLKSCYYNQRFPDIATHNFYTEIHDITDFIFNSSDTEFADSIKFNRYFDVDNLIDWHLLLLVTNNGDGWYKNFYLSRKNAAAPYRFTPWDYDHSFGRDGDGEPSKETLIDLTRMPLLHRLMETNAFGYRQQLYAKYMRLKTSGVLTVEHLHEMIGRNVAILRQAMAENVKKWPMGTIAYFTASSFDSEVKRMKDWVEEHLPRVEKYLAEQNSRRTKAKPKITIPPQPPYPMELYKTSAVPL